MDIGITRLRHLIRERNVYRRAWRALSAMDQHAALIESGRGLLGEDPDACRPCLRAVAQRLRGEPSPEQGCEIWVERDAAVAATLDWEGAR